MFYRRIKRAMAYELVITLLDSLPEGDVVWTHYLVIELWNWGRVNWKKMLQGYYPARQLEL